MAFQKFPTLLSLRHCPGNHGFPKKKFSQFCSVVWPASCNEHIYVHTGCSKKLCSKGICVLREQFSFIFSIKVSSESSIFELFHVVFLLDLKTTKICYNHFFECKSKIEFPDLFKFTVFHILKYEKI